MRFLELAAAVAAGNLSASGTLALYVTFRERRANAARYAQLVKLRDQYEAEAEKQVK